MAGAPDFDLYRLSEEHTMLRETVRALAEAKIAPHAAAVDEEARFPQEALDALTAADLHAVHVPESYGGAGADALATVLVIEEVARVCASSSLIPAVNKLGSLPVVLSGSEELKKKYLGPLAKGDGMFSYCLSEPDAGSDAAGMKTKAVRDGDFWVLNGVKRWITNAGVSEYYTVMAVTDPEKRSKGISAFVVEKGDEGVSFGAPEKKLGIKGSPTREVYFDNVRIPADRMIGEEGTGFATAMKTLDHTRITIAAQALGIAQGALDYAKGYVQERKQFGKPIGQHQLVQEMLAKSLANITASIAMCTQVSRMLDEDRQGDAHSAMAKMFVTARMREVVAWSREICGGNGIVTDYQAARYFADAEALYSYEGTFQMNALIVGRAIIGKSAFA